MYMDENDVRCPRDRVDGELLRRLLKEEGVDGNHCVGTPAPYRNRGVGRGCDGSMREGAHVRGCDGAVRIADRRCGMTARNEAASGGTCGCDDPHHDHGTCDCDGHDHHHVGDGAGAIGNTYPCGENGVKERSLAMVYAPIQYWRGAYDPKTALSRGTMFRELDMPFYGAKHSAKGGNCRGY